MIVHLLWAAVVSMAVSIGTQLEPESDQTEPNDLTKATFLIRGLH